MSWSGAATSCRRLRGRDLSLSSDKLKMSFEEGLRREEGMERRGNDRFVSRLDVRYYGWRAESACLLKVRKSRASRRESRGLGRHPAERVLAGFTSAVPGKHDKVYTLSNTPETSKSKPKAKSIFVDTRRDICANRGFILLRFLLREARRELFFAYSPWGEGPDLEGTGLFPYLPTSHADRQTGRRKRTRSFDNEEEEGE